MTVGRDLEAPPQRIAVSGSSGLVGSALVPYFQDGGHTVHRIVRSQRDSREPLIHWDPKNAIETPKLEGLNVVIHLAGENIAGGRWTRTKKRKIRESRVQGTRTLCEALATLENKPRTLICASAIGFYGDRGKETIDESSAPGEGFLPEVCQAWEAVCDAAREAGIRVVNLRFGMILSARDGALAKMLTPFRLGIAGIVGSGEQYWSWIAIDDVLNAVHHVMHDESLIGPVNVVAPEPVTNREFTLVLGRVLHRPTVLPLPGFAARLALGEMADDLLLASARVVPRKLQDAGHDFRYPELEPALRHLLGREAAGAPS